MRAIIKKLPSLAETTAGMGVVANRFNCGLTFLVIKPSFLAANKISTVVNNLPDSLNS